MNEEVNNPTQKSKVRKGDKYPDAISAMKAAAKRNGEIKKRTTSTGYMPRAEMIKKNKKFGAKALSEPLISKKGMKTEQRKDDAWRLHGEYTD
ncbi:MAG: hypothetical protein V4481_05100 [Patescibacteria group bacterium]